MADNSQLLKSEVPPANGLPSDQLSTTFKGVDLNADPPAYNTVNTYPQNHGTTIVNTVTNQPPAAMATNVIIAQPRPLDQDRPSHGLAMGSLLCATLTLILSGGMALFCAVPAIVLSGMAFAQDYHVDRAKTMSLISLGLSAVYWILAVIAAVILVIVVVVQTNQCIGYDCGFPDYQYHGHGFSSYTFG